MSTIIEPDESDVFDAQKAVETLHKDIKYQASGMTREEARYLVHAYYSVQEERKRFNNQTRALDKDNKPNALAEWFAKQNRVLENQLKNALMIYADNQPAGRWMLSLYGVGPVLAAGFLAHLDITRANTAGAFWAFAGLDPRQEWKKGQKRPWNAELKTLAWKFGETMVKFANKPECYYGHVYQRRKVEEQERNARGDYVDQALKKAEVVGDNTDAYQWYSGEWARNPKFNPYFAELVDALPQIPQSSGKHTQPDPEALKRLEEQTQLRPMLSPGHIHSRAKRYATKLFMAHLHEVMYQEHYKVDPPHPYPIAHMGHTHKINPPGYSK